MKRLIEIFQLALLPFSSQLWAQTQRVVDIPTRTGVTQRMLALALDRVNVTFVDLN
jgi:hypothetical protein